MFRFGFEGAVNRSIVYFRENTPKQGEPADNDFLLLGISPFFTVSKSYKQGNIAAKILN
jgi:hypothetical protein